MTRFPTGLFLAAALSLPTIVVAQGDVLPRVPPPWPDGLWQQLKSAIDASILH